MDFGSIENAPRVPDASLGSSALFKLELEDAINASSGKALFEIAAFQELINRRTYYGPPEAIAILILACINFLELVEMVTTTDSEKQGVIATAFISVPKQPLVHWYLLAAFLLIFQVRSRIFMCSNLHIGGMAWPLTLTPSSSFGNKRSMGHCARNVRQSILH